jgi:hypothetical protein
LKDGFLSNAKRFIIYAGEQVLELWMRLSQSIYLAVGIVGGKNGWFHQILEVIYTVEF